MSRYGPPIPGSERGLVGNQLERNIRLIPVHQALARALVWLPVFVLFTQRRFGLDGAVLLSALYYLFVVVLEVPSGWMSDRMGRVLTLRAAGLAWVAAHLCFLVGGEQFVVFAVGQLLLAAGFASLSGTDVSFHYDTLEAVGRAHDYGDRQARVSAVGFLATAAGALLGGTLGLVDLRWAFVAALILALAQFGVAMKLVEPPSTGEALDLLPQLRTCLGYLRNRYLGWIFFYGILMVTLEHVAHTVLQPWLAEALGRSPDDLGATPLVAGFVVAAVSVVGAGAARTSAPLGRRFGIAPTLMGFAVLSAVVVSAMALWVHVVVVAFVVFRSAQGAAAPVLISTAVAPRVAQEHRATFLSLDSLAGRLGYGVLLLSVASTATDDVQAVLATLSMVAWGLVALLAATAVATLRR